MDPCKFIERIFEKYIFAATQRADQCDISYLSKIMNEICCKSIYKIIPVEVPTNFQM